MDRLLFQHLGIFGVGLLGGSLGLALKNLFPSIRIVGIGRSKERLQTALNRGAIDEFTCDPASISPRLDALVLCTPVRMVPTALQAALPALESNAIVTDVGSTKATLVRECESIVEGRGHFVGSHPMAGSHKTGVEAARADLFHNKICVVTRTERSHPPALETVIALWRVVGMRIVQLNPAEHDRLTAFSSHLPHLIASALCHAAKSQGKEIDPVLGNGFRDTTRIAQGDPAMWVDICLENREAIRVSLLSFQQILKDLYDRIDSADEAAIRDFLEQAQRWKRRKRSS